MADVVDHTQYVTLDELQPSVNLAACYSFDVDSRHRYRVPGLHLLLITEGSISGRSAIGEAVAHPGEMLCFPSTDRNEYANHAPLRYYEAHVFLALPPRHRHWLWLDGIGPLPLHVRLGSAAPRMQRAFDAVCLNLAQTSAVHRARVASALWEIIAILAECARPESGAAPVLDLWQRARQRLGEDLARELEVRAVAAEVDLSVDHFIRGFRRRFGISPGEYRAQQRLRQGAHLLRSGDEPIKAVARAVGFTDAYAFTRAFRRWLGVLPSDLRAGRAALPPDAHPDQPLLPVNRHILPPAAGADHYEQFEPKR